MKKFLLLTIAFSSAVLFSQAQITKGTVLLGGGFDVQTLKNKYVNPDQSDTKDTKVQIGPSIGLAVKDNSVFGVNLRYGHTFNSNSSNSSFDQKDYSYAGGIFFRRYMTLGKGFYLFGEADANYFASKTSYINSQSGQVNRSNGASIYVYPGITYAVNKRMHLELSMSNLAGMSYNNYKFESNNNGVIIANKSEGFDVYTNLNTASALALGFRFMLGK